jgi:hypothetical protein
MGENVELSESLVERAVAIAERSTHQWWVVKRSLQTMQRDESKA